MAIVLVGGGSRSGKTAFALNRAREHGQRLAYVATAEARDREMCERARAHRTERGEAFETIEEPLDVAGVIERRSGEFDALVIDCLTLWLSNLIARGADLELECGRLARAARTSLAVVILVTNEVGTGIVPENELARRFRDHAGWLNQRIAALADEVYWMVFGCHLKVK